MTELAAASDARCQLNGSAFELLDLGSACCSSALQLPLHPLQFFFSLLQLFLTCQMPAVRAAAAQQMLLM